MALLALLLFSCAGSVGVQPGSAVVPPEREAPSVEVLVLAADDLGGLEAVVMADGVLLAAEGGESPIVIWENSPIELEVSAEGFQPFGFILEHYPDAGRIEFRLEPVILQGRVTSDTGRPLPGVRVALGSSTDTTDNDGRYSLERAVAGTILLSRPAWEPIEFPWDGVIDRFDMAMAPRIIRGIRIAAEDFVERERLQGLLSLADVTGVNALVVDLKVEDGTVVHSTEVRTATRIGAVSSSFDLAEVVELAEAHDLYLIGRVGVFQDNFYAAAEPSRAILNEDGTLWRSRNGFAWLDPSDPASFEYSIDLAKEACVSGFDEIQFDYVSYPIGGDLTMAVFDADYNQEVRVASINAFLSRAYSKLNPIGCAVSVTLLGIVLESTSDEGTGQSPGAMSRIVDVLSPTLYSTNYGPGWRGFENPNDHAVEIIGSALRSGVGKLDGYGYIRPWLQTWGISTADQRAVLEVASDAGMGWMLWSNSANFSADVLPSR